MGSMDLRKRIKALSARDSLIGWGIASFLALVLVRWKVAQGLGLGFFRALEAGMATGWLFDLAALALGVAAAALFELLKVRPAWTLWGWTGLVWLSSLANALHVAFFGFRLDFWVVRLHWQDVAHVHDSAAGLGFDPLIIGSVLCVVLSFWLVSRVHTVFPTRLGRRGWHAKPAAALVALLLAWGSWRAPQLINQQYRGLVVSDQILRVWYYELKSNKWRKGATTTWISNLEADTLARNPIDTLRRYRHFGEYHNWVLDGPSPISGMVSDEALLEGFYVEPSATEPSPKAGTHLERPLTTDPLLTATLRQRFGLPKQGPINLVVLFGESLRAYELNDPQLGPDVFPQISKHLRKHGIYFAQAYSSAHRAGQTVRGQYSTLCSSLPNILGAAVYRAHTTLSVRCIQEVAAQNGYATAWINSFESSYHGKRQFEMLHGTQRFYDRAYFTDKGLEQKIGGWGFADGPVLKEAVNILEATAAQDKPVFAHVLTISTHHPWTVLPQVSLSEATQLRAGKGSEYHGYLSRLKYMDQAVGAFVDKLFEGPLGDNTLVVLLGDHSTSHAKPRDPSFTPLQEQEAQYRIPVAFLTKNMPGALRIPRVIHQIDVTPTLAQIAGLQGDVTWLGRSAFAPEGSPFVYQYNRGVYYRTAARTCYYLAAQTKQSCWDTTTVDPLGPVAPESIAPSSGHTQFFHDVVNANFNAIALNQFSPRRSLAQSASGRTH